MFSSYYAERCDLACRIQWGWGIGFSFSAEKSIPPPKGQISPETQNAQNTNNGTDSREQIHEIVKILNLLECENVRHSRSHLMVVPILTHYFPLSSPRAPDSLLHWIKHMSFWQDQEERIGKNILYSSLFSLESLSFSLSPFQTVIQGWNSLSLPL